LPQLPQGVIHNDANDHNGVVAGYRAVRPSQDAELALLSSLILTRLAVSVSNSTHQQKLRPDDPYVVISERSAWAVLEALDALPPRGPEQRAKPRPSFSRWFRVAAPRVPSSSGSERAPGDWFSCGRSSSADVCWGTDFRRSIAMHSSDPTDLAARWLGKAWEHASAAERAVLTQLHRREHTSRAPTAIDDRSFGERVADAVARSGGSWTFIGAFMGFLALWVTANVWLLRAHPFDPYPFIFLNLLLSMLAALQAPIIMMSQNRQATRDREMAEHDYAVNLKAELEIMALHDKLDQLRAEQLERILAAQTEQIALLRQMLERR